MRVDYIISKNPLSSHLILLCNSKLPIMALLTTYIWRNEQTIESKDCFGGKKIKLEVVNQSQKKVTGNKPKAVENRRFRLDFCCCSKPSSFNPPGEILGKSLYLLQL